MSGTSKASLGILPAVYGEGIGGYRGLGRQREEIR